ncbi:hypothetical protein V1478_009561 [Vespula squamosa]|uniref:Uncharacterized protein n=1 Tax=Vespula squamosa TaxID=30214 RepID=A0ABD2AQ01_VESSQ
MSHLDFLKLESHEINQFHTDGQYDHCALALLSLRTTVYSSSLFVVIIFANVFRLLLWVKT